MCASAPTPLGALVNNLFLHCPTHSTVPSSDVYDGTLLVKVFPCHIEMLQYQISPVKDNEIAVILL